MKPLWMDERWFFPLYTLYCCLKRPSKGCLPYLPALFVSGSQMMFLAQGKNNSSFSTKWNTHSTCVKWTTLLNYYRSKNSGFSHIFNRPSKKCYTLFRFSWNRTGLLEACASGRIRVIGDINYVWLKPLIRWPSKSIAPPDQEDQCSLYFHWEMNHLI